jgi:hypothetical protein
MSKEQERTETDTIQIPKSLLEKILNYIAAKPYLEVAGLIGEVQTAVQSALAKGSEVGQ